MKLHFYGTGASEGFPALFCQCENCARARKLGGKNIRTRASLGVDEELLIDFSQDTYSHCLYGGLDLTKIRHVLITHSHSDHFCPADIANILPPMAVTEPDRILHVYGNATVTDRLDSILRRFPESAGKMRLHRIRAFDRFAAGEYEITALRADHMETEESLLYVIQGGGKTFLYGQDSAMFPEETWQALKDFRFDCVLLDCTSVNRPHHFRTHMSFEDNLSIKRRMEEEGMAGDGTIFIATHFVHTFAPFHERLTKIFSPYGFVAAYDGMEIEF